MIVARQPEQSEWPHSQVKLPSATRTFATNGYSRIKIHYYYYNYNNNNNNYYYYNYYYCYYYML